MNVRQRHPPILRLLGLAFFAFGTFLLAVPAVGEIGPGAFWQTLGVTTSAGLFFCAIGGYLLLACFDVEIDPPSRKVTERRRLLLPLWSKERSFDRFDRLTIAQKGTRDGSHEMVFYQLHLKGTVASVLLQNDTRYETVRALGMRVSRVLQLDVHDRTDISPGIRPAERATRPLRERLQEEEVLPRSPEEFEPLRETADGAILLPKRIPAWPQWLLVGLLSVLWFGTVGMLLARILLFPEGSLRNALAVGFGVVFVGGPLLALAKGLLKTFTSTERLIVDSRRLRLEERWLLGGREREIESDELMEIEVSDEDLVAYGLEDTFSFGYGLSPEQLHALRAVVCRRLVG